MDIITISDLLNEFVLAESLILSQQKIKHPTTIGSMYEGLTSTVVNKAIFKDLNLKVVKNSFIEGCDKEFDVLLVEGDGENIPFTERYQYQPEQVIAIIQVRKNLYSKDMEEGYNDFKFLLDYFESRPIEDFMKDLFRDGFRNTCRKDISGELSENEKSIFYSLKVDTILPIRVIWGYNGFSSEYALRKSFYEHLLKNITTDTNNNRKAGFGPYNFPSLVICGQYSLFKINGMPFIPSKDKPDWWSFYVSSSYNPTYRLLELIWTRLSYKFDLSTEIFGEDLCLEPANRFLDCRWQKLDSIQGWEYHAYLVSDEKLKENTTVTEWQPIELNAVQHVIISELCEKEEINLDRNECLEKYVVDGGYLSLEDFLKKLKTTGLVFIENKKLRLLTDKCQCVVMPNGKFFAGENKSGRLSNWIKKEIEKSKNNTNPN